MDPANMLLGAASDLPPSATQKPTVDSLMTDLEANEATTMHPFDELNADLEAGVRAGKLDEAKLKSDEAAIDSAMQAHIATEASILDKLHATLDDGQRKAAVDAVRAKQTAREERWSRGMHGADMSERRAERLSKELDLDDAQKKKVTTIVKKEERNPREDEKQRLDALLSAFPNPTFDAKAVLAPAPGKSPRAFAEQRVAFVKQVLPILKPEQRDKFAASLTMERTRMMRRGGDGDEHSSDMPTDPPAPPAPN